MPMAPEPLQSENSTLVSRLIAGRLALDFANTASVSSSLTWEAFVAFLAEAEVVTSERASRLQSLVVSEPLAVEPVVAKILRLRESLLTIFSAVARRRPVAKSWIEPLNEILRITEGHDKLVLQNEAWRLHYIAREQGLEWLLAAIARSAADLLIEGPEAPVRRCANPKCRLFFYDDSRTHQRRWCSMAICGNRHKVAAFFQRKPKKQTS
jgi:predicted RNA-binding Zn ribbon-like protein